MALNQVILLDMLFLIDRSDWRKIRLLKQPILITDPSRIRIKFNMQICNTSFNAQFI